MQGNLSEFTMAELLQLFALAERTGALQVETPRGSSRVLVESGRVIGIGLPDFNVHEEIVALELLPTHSGASLQSVTPAPMTPGLSFIVRNLVEPERWDLFVRRCLEQQVYPYLTREQGTFEAVIERSPFCPLVVSLSVQQLVLDGSRWEAEMSEHRQEGFNLETRFERSDRVPAQAAVTAAEWLVWSILTVPQKVSRIAERIGIPDLDTLSTARKLQVDGWIQRSVE